eukprot:9476826-Pyramimonas_sp.AAC.2
MPKGGGRSLRGAPLLLDSCGFVIAFPFPGAPSGPRRGPRTGNMAPAGPRECCEREQVHPQASPSANASPRNTCPPAAPQG